MHNTRQNRIDAKHKHQLFENENEINLFYKLLEEIEMTIQSSKEERWIFKLPLTYSDLAKVAIFTTNVVAENQTFQLSLNLLV